MFTLKPSFIRVVSAQFGVMAGRSGTISIINEWHECLAPLDLGQVDNGAEG